jgi:hypothetical protein
MNWFIAPAFANTGKDGTGFLFPYVAAVRRGGRAIFAPDCFHRMRFIPTRSNPHKFPPFSFRFLPHPVNPAPIPHRRETISHNLPAALRYRRSLSKPFLRGLYFAQKFLDAQ